MKNPHYIPKTKGSDWKSGRDHLGRRTYKLKINGRKMVEMADGWHIDCSDGHWSEDAGDLSWASAICESLVSWNQVHRYRDEEKRQKEAKKSSR